MTEKRLRSFGIWLLMTYGAWRSLLLLQWLAFCLIQTKRRALVLLSGEFFQTNEAQFICSCCFLLQYSHLIFLLRGKHRPKHSTVDIRWYLNHFHLPISHDIWTCPLTILYNLGHLDRYSQRGSLWSFNTQTRTDKGISPSKYNSWVFIQKRQRTTQKARK